jgi:tetratricopeptide (TPR) repeat protein
MDVCAVATTLEQASDECRNCNYRGAVALLLPLLPSQENLCMPQEVVTVLILSSAYRHLLDFNSALPHAERLVKLQKHYFTRTLAHARSLEELCMVHTGLRTFSPALEAITEALSILDELGLQQEEDYGMMLSDLALLEHLQGRYKEALVIYDKAKAILLHYRDRKSYGALVSWMGESHKALQNWNEALACCKEAHEHCRSLYGNRHPEYATMLWNLALLFGELKQYEEAVPRLDEVHTIWQREFGDQHETTMTTLKVLTEARKLAERSRQLTKSRRLLKQANYVINPDPDFHMCTICGTVSEEMLACACFRAWYCNTDCQLLDWSMHKLLCDVCFQCGTLVAKVKRCSGCKKAVYCNAECSKAHWPIHKKDCVAAAGK